MKINASDKLITLNEEETELLYQALQFVSNSTMFCMSDEKAERMENLLNKFPSIEE